MFRKKYFSLLIAAALFLTGSLFVLAQTAPVRGKVELRKADGTTEPMAGAIIEVFRTDSKGKGSTAKTNKKGEFGFAGLMLGQTFALSISAPNIKPGVFPNVRAGNENISIVVVEGDGKRLTEEEVREFLTAPAVSKTNDAAANAPATTAPTAEGAPAKPAKESAEDKKKREEYEKQVTDINAKNERIKNSDAIIKKSQEEGSKAFSEKNYDVAIARFEEGYKAAPEFVGSAPIMLNNKSQALTDRAIALHNQNTKVTDVSQKVANKNKIKEDFAAALDASNTSWAVVKNSTETKEVSAQRVAEIKLQTLRAAEHTLELMVKTEAVDEKKTDIARDLTQAYINLETDAAKKNKAQLTLADVFRTGGDFGGAVTEYKKSLEMTPDNADALAGVGLSLFALGASTSPENTAQMQEGLNYMQRFTEVAPDNHPLKSSVKETVDYLKTVQLTPQKTGKPAGKKKP